MSAISSQTTNDALDAVDKYDADSFATILAMLDRRKAGAAAWEPIFRDRGEFGVNALSIAHPTLDPLEHGDFKTADVGNIVTKMRNEATEANLLDTVPYEALKSDRSVRTPLSPSLRPHICPDGSANDWGRCLGGPDACRGWYCVACGAARPAPWRPCFLGGLCAFYAPEPCCPYHSDSPDSALSRRPLLAPASLRRSAGHSVKPIFDTVRSSVISHRLKLTDIALLSVQTPEATRRSTVPDSAPGAPAKAGMNAYYEHVKFQNHGSPFPVDIRPPPHYLEICGEHVQMDPPCLPKLARLEPAFAADPIPKRYQQISHLRNCGRAAFIVFSPEMGTGILSHLTKGQDCDTIMAYKGDADSFLRVGAKMIEVLAFFDSVGAFLEESQADEKQTLKFILQLWNVRYVLGRSGPSFAPSSPRLFPPRLRRFLLATTS